MNEIREGKSNGVLNAEVTSEPSTYLLVLNLHRPFTTPALKTFLSQYGKIEDLWINNIKTHCIVKLEDKDIAIKIKEGIDGTVWPPEGRKLQAGYIEEEVAKNLKENSGTLAFVSNEKNTTVEVLNSNESSLVKNLPHNNDPDTLSSQYSKRNDHPSKRVKIAKTKRTRSERRSLGGEQENGKQDSMLELNKIFRKTITKPEIFFMPVSSEQVEKNKKKQLKATNM